MQAGEAGKQRHTEYYRQASTCCLPYSPLRQLFPSRRTSARGRLRLSTVMRVQPLECMCLTSSLDILPAPMMQTCGEIMQGKE